MNCTRIIIVWREPDSVPLKADVESYYVEGSFLVIELPEDQLVPGVESKTVLYPYDTIKNVSVEELSEKQPSGYREDSTFRETPEKSPWFKGAGLAGDEQGE